MSSSSYIHPLSQVELEPVPAGLKAWSWTHIMPKAVLGSDCKLGERVFVENGARLGDCVTVKNGVDIYDGVQLESGVFVGPAVVFTNIDRPRAFNKRPQSDFLPTLVGCGATLGAGAILVCGVKIAPFAFVGAGALVTRDIGAFELCLGQPARVKAFVDLYGNPLVPNKELGESEQSACEGRMRYVFKNGKIEPSFLPAPMWQWYQQSFWNKRHD